MNDELKPCPFCGGPAEIISGPPGCHYIRCQCCHASTDDRGYDRAIRSWNTRAPIPIDEAVREDATRYRYLRNRDPGPEGKPVPRGLFIGMVPENLILTEEDADAAIDVARLKDAPATGEVA